MRYFAGLDISDATTNICIVDELGTVVHEIIAETKPESIVSKLKSLNIPIEQVGMETGAKSNWLWHVLNRSYPTTCYDALKTSQLISLKINKTDKNDARIIAEVVRLNGLSDVLNLQVHVKSESSQEIVTLIRAREDLVQQSIHVYNVVRGICKTHGVAIPPTSPENFTKVVHKTIESLPLIVALSIQALIALYDPIQNSIRMLTQKIEIIAKKNPNAELLTSIPEVGPITALYYVSLIDDPKRFSESKSVGAYFGLTPLQQSSGERHYQGSISKRGDSLMRKLLVGVARRILQRNAPCNDLKKWGQKKEKSRGQGKAAVALARHTSVIMLAMLQTLTPYKEKPATSVQKKSLVLTPEGLASLMKLSQEKGSIDLRSIKHLEKLLETANA